MGRNLGRNIISVELRKKKDDDIKEQLDEMVTDYLSQSDIVRTALRFYFAHLNNTPLTAPSITPQVTFNNTPDINSIELQQAQKDDTQLDAAIDNLLNF